MLVYSGDKRTFVEDVRKNRIADRILEALARRGQGSVSESERRSWDQSLQYMKNVLEADDIPADAGIALEYRIPQTAKRVDVIVSGRDADDRAACVVVELKQWERVAATGKDAVVRTVLGGAERETTHPSYQAWSYAVLLEDFNETVQAERIRLAPCAYLHNCSDGSGAGGPHYQEYLDRAPLFLKQDMERLQRFIRKHVRHGDRDRVLYRIEHGRIRPSRDLANSLAALLEGKREFLMIDDQKLAYEAALEVTELGHAGRKQVLIVEGGPGTGKSVVAVNLLVELIRRYRNVHYVTPNRAPRQIYEGRLTGTMTKSRFSNLFKGSASYDGSNENELDVLLVDEAHRLLERSQYQRKGANQIRDIIRAARASVFFIDEAQQVTWNDTGSPAEIKAWARSEGATVHWAALQSQFRCNGSDGYLAWLDRVLGIRDTAQDDLTGIDYRLEVVDSPTALRERIRGLDRAGHKARLVAGYCWDWASKRDPAAWDITLPEHGFAMQWNLNDDEGRYIDRPHSVEQAGCIHTVQGLELDYVGVIIGPDLVVRDGRILPRPEHRARTDRSLHGYKSARSRNPAAADARAAALIRNTYRTLMSRGLKGCYIYCTDAETQAYFKQQVARAFAESGEAGEQPSTEAGPASEHGREADNPASDGIRFLRAEEVTAADNAVPFINLPVAAGGFAEGFAETVSLQDAETWVALPDFYRARPNLFVARVEGESMNRRIPNGAYCLFEAKPGGSRNGRVVLVYHRDIQDPDHGGGLTVKLYRSEKVLDPDNEWCHDRITLACDTLTPGYEDIILDGAEADELQVLGVLRAVLDTPQ